MISSEETLNGLQAKLASFTAAARLDLRTCLAQHASLPIPVVSIEGIKSGRTAMPSHCDMQPVLRTGKPAAEHDVLPDRGPSASTPEAALQCAAVQLLSAGVTVAVHVELGSRKAAGEQLLAALQTLPETIFSNSQLCAAVGLVDAASVHAELNDATPGLAKCSSTTSQADLERVLQQTAPVSKELVEVGQCCVAESFFIHNLADD